jgi:GR25 family glycosyltransferase involved in LPS biosynthesis
MFDNFGPVYIINLKRREDRKIILEGLLKERSIKDYTFIDAVDAKNDLSDLVDTYPSKNVTKQEMAAMMSHLKAIRYWLETSESDYALICEDDIDFNLSDYWGFTWNEFINTIDVEYDILQLSPHYIDDYFDIALHKKRDNEYSAAFYLIKREYAKQIINKYFINEKYNFSYSDKENIADHYSLFKKDRCYAMALLIPNPRLGTDNLTRTEEDYGFSEEWLNGERLKQFYRNEVEVKKLWQDNILTLDQLLGKKTI